MPALRIAHLDSWLLLRWTAPGIGGMRTLFNLKPSVWVEVFGYQLPVPFRPLLGKAAYVRCVVATFEASSAHQLPAKLRDHHLSNFLWQGFVDQQANSRFAQRLNRVRIWSLAASSFPSVLV